MSVLALIIWISTLTIVKSECYWNNQCAYDLFSTKTPYNSVRGDIRDVADIAGCEPVTIWSLNRHGNRNPGSDTIEEMRVISQIKDEIIANHEAGNSYFCAQDIEDLGNWAWNKTIQTAPSYLTGTGYEELYDIGSRIRHKFPGLLKTDDIKKFYFRTTNEQRTVVSSIAYVNGLTEGTDLTPTVDGPFLQDEIIRPYEICEKYQEEVKKNPIIAFQMDSYMESPPFIAVIDRVQDRLGISLQLTSTDVYSIFELCRFYRSWSVNHRSPWCAVFTAEDIEVLEYLDDMRHYYRNGYGSVVNAKLGEQAAKDLYTNFEDSIRGEGKNIITYFTHDTMMEMFFCALGLFDDGTPVTYDVRDENRKWRTSYISSFSTNFIAVLNRCNDTEYRIQFFVNEKPTSLCPEAGCTLEEFREKFQKFEHANLDFCLGKTKIFRAVALP